MFDVSFATVAETLTVWPGCKLCAVDGVRLTEIGGELAQPSVNISGAQPRKISANANVLLWRVGQSPEPERKILACTGFEPASEPKRRKDQNDTVDMRTPSDQLAIYETYLAIIRIQPGVFLFVLIPEKAKNAFRGHSTSDRTSTKIR